MQWGTQSCSGGHSHAVGDTHMQWEDTDMQWGIQIYGGPVGDMYVVGYRHAVGGHKHACSGNTINIIASSS